MSKSSLVLPVLCCVFDGLHFERCSLSLSLTYCHATKLHKTLHSVLPSYLPIDWPTYIHYLPTYPPTSWSKESKGASSHKSHETGTSKKLGSNQAILQMGPSFLPAFTPPPAASVLSEVGKCATSVVQLFYTAPVQCSRSSLSSQNQVKEAWKID